METLDRTVSFGYRVGAAPPVVTEETMEPEDLEPRTKKPPPKNLDELSIEALGEYIAELEAEIARVREAIAAKEKAREGAESVFKF